MEINKEPKILTSHPTTSTHSIVIADPTDNVHPIHHPTTTRGVVSYFRYSLPTSAEFGDEYIPPLSKNVEKDI